MVGAWVMVNPRLTVNPHLLCFKILLVFQVYTLGLKLCTPAGATQKHNLPQRQPNYYLYPLSLSLDLLSLYE